MAEAGSRRGSFIVLAAPSGAGKTSLVRKLLRRVSDLRFSVSYTTRPPREEEVDGKHYKFVSPGTFEQMVGAGAFVEHAEVFGHRYGTSRGHVESLLAEGHTVVLEIDWQGARQIRKAVPEATSVFILPPSMDVLEQRLRGRGTDSPETIARRLRDAVDDLTHWDEFDYVLINDDLERAADELAAIVNGGNGSHRTSCKSLRVRVEAIVGGAASRQRPAGEPAGPRPAT